MASQLHDGDEVRLIIPQSYIPDDVVYVVVCRIPSTPGCVRVRLGTSGPPIIIKFADEWIRTGRVTNPTLVYIENLHTLPPDVLQVVSEHML